MRTKEVSTGLQEREQERQGAQRLKTEVTVMHIVYRCLVDIISSGVGGGFPNTRSQSQLKPGKVIDRTV